MKMSTPSPLRVYIAGPYTRPDPVYNANRAVEAANNLASAGLVPYISHLTLFWHYHGPKPYVWWLDYDMNWLDCCHCILRLSGKSEGADKEVEHARHVSIPVFYSTEEVIQWSNLQVASAHSAHLASPGF